MSHAPSPSCVLIGGESLLVQCGQMLRTQGWQVRGVFTDAAPLQAWAVQQGLPVWGTDALEAVCATLDFDWLFSITHLRVVPPAVLARPRRGAVNFHDGPLPRYGGLNAPLWALANGETSFGITWHRMVPQVDAGEVLVQQTFPVEPSDTALSLNARCWEAAVETFPALLARLHETTASSAPATPPVALDLATYHRGADRPAGLGLLDPVQDTALWLRLFRVADTGRYVNPFLLPWLWTGRRALLPARATALVPSETQRLLPAGTIVSAASDALTVKVADGLVRLDGVRAADGTTADVARALTSDGLAVGATLPAVDPAWIAALDAAVRPAVVRERHWVEQLSAVEPLPAPGVVTAADGAPDASGTAVWWTAPMTWHDDAFDHAFDHVVDAAAENAAAGDRRLALRVALVSLFVARHGLRESGHVALSTPSLRTAAAAAPLLSATVPLAVHAALTTPIGVALQEQVARGRAAGNAPGVLQTVPVRYPALTARPASTRHLPVCVVVGDYRSEQVIRCEAALIVQLHHDGRVSWRAPKGGATGDDLARLHRRLQTLVSCAAATPLLPVGQLPLVDADDQRQLATWGVGPEAPLDESDTVPAQVARQAARTPDAVALVAGEQTLTYADLMARVDAVARQLVAHGVRADQRVALLCTRTADLVVGMLGILRAGGAYVPLDPAYPVERVRLMLDDCGAAVVVTQRPLADGWQETLSASSRTVVCIDELAVNTPDVSSTTADLPAAHGSQLAYVIYTSGSTGRPKGVMVEHRQVVNFFRGMDAVLGTTPGVWLAVTSMSFDISVLELLWTLTRGYTVVLAGASEAGSATGAATGTTRAPQRPVGFSLFYFSADEQEQARDKYRLLLEGARFADTHGFEAVWTPERHFHAFGGLYPNPSVTGAAVAAITSRVGIRAGSCVMPLHHPARVAEEWSVVDNLSNGRVGISFAAGWQPNDFVFRPEHYADAKQVMFRDVALVQRLWRGEAVPFEGPRGPVEVRTLPRPVQPELPVWITTAGNPETFAQAGTFGGNVLTHLLGQTIEELAPKIAAYRAAWRAAGHPGEGRVSLMLHTFVGGSDEQVRELVREPMTAYLRTSVGLIKQYAGVFPTLRQRPGSDGKDLDFASLTREEMDALLDFSFERYYSTSALFGTVDSAAAMVDRVRAIGVDELACLVDFGLDTDTVLAHLPHLDALRQRCTAESATADSVTTRSVTTTAPVSVAAAAAARSDDASLSALVARYGVTHLQCTPSMARLLLAATDTTEALRQLSVMCVGGEALSPALAADLHAVLRGRLCNMYGPTETTIWSSVQEVALGHAVSLGRPIANTTLQVVDPATLALLPPGTPGELCIGGAGVVRGYLDRPELTAERFVQVADITGAVSRLYRTGDLVQCTTDGTWQFLGRLDHQVKVRGYRIELGEIEAAIAADPAVQEVVVLAREDVAGDPRLVAYCTARPGTAVSVEQMRTRLQSTLPEFMVPSQYVVLADMPRTPNLKIDRKALPAPSAAIVAAEAPPTVAPEGDLERTIATIWCEVLRVPTVGSRDNFFDLGGHSLLVVQVHQRLTATLQRAFPITDLFRFPTVQAIAAHLTRNAQPTTQHPQPTTPPRDDIARRAELRRAAASRHVRPRD